MTKPDAGLTISLPASDPGSTPAWGSKKINLPPQSCLYLTWSGYLSKRRGRRRISRGINIRKVIVSNNSFVMELGAPFQNKHYPHRQSITKHWYDRRHLEQGVAMGTIPPLRDFEHVIEEIQRQPLFLPIETVV